MNPATLQDAESLIKKVEAGLKKSKSKNVFPVVCPPYVYLHPVLKKVTKSAVGTQNISQYDSGSRTGEVSVGMVQASGAENVIIGHSERRKMGETDQDINAKVLLTLKAGLTPIICIGEETRDTEGHYLALIKSQLEGALKGVNKKDLESVIIAYEPVWAIGATQAMNAHDIHQMMILIKKSLLELYALRTPAVVPVLYGGAVDPTNAESIFTEGAVDGLLIGRQSLDPQAFLEIISIAESI